MAQDVLGMFLRTPDEQGQLMSDDEICDAMRTLLLGGHDTTASTLTWVLERVSRFPEALARLETAALEEDDEYLDAVIKETMRLRPAFPLTARLATEPFELPGLNHPERHHGRPLHHARAPPSRALSRPTHASGPSVSSILAPGPTPGSPSAADRDDALAPPSLWPRPESCSGQSCATPASNLLARRSERVAHRNVFIVPARGGRITCNSERPTPTTSRLFSRLHRAQI